MESSSRYLWVDYAKGICILAVVCLYVNGVAVHELGSSGLIQYFVDFAKPFRMPDFFLLSGLFLAKAIDKPWKHYLDRKVFHYLYFYLLWIFISWALRIATGDLNESPLGLVKSLISMALIWPYHQFWFILLLPIYFFAVRITRIIPVWVMFPALCGLHVLHHYHEFKLPVINDFNNRFVFFYSGFAFSAYFFKFSDWVKSHPYHSLMGVAVWFVANSFLVFNGYSKTVLMTLLLGFAGCLGVIAIAVLLMKCQKGFHWLSYLGGHSIAVYLPFDWILTGLAAVVAFGAIPLNTNVYVFMMVSLSIIGSLCLYWVTRSLPIARCLFVRPRWIRMVK